MDDDEEAAQSRELLLHLFDSRAALIADYSCAVSDGLLMHGQHSRVDDRGPHLTGITSHSAANRRPRKT